MRRSCCFHESLKRMRRKYIIVVAVMLVNMLLIKRQWESKKQDKKSGLMPRIAFKTKITKNYLISEGDGIDPLRSRIKEREKQTLIFEEYHNTTIQQRKKKLPSVIGIGVEKCGTDGLITFLAQHPLVKVPWDVHTETHFFNKHNKPNLEDYRNIFPLANDREITMEKTPQYFDGLPHNLPETMAKSLPGVKLLLMVCDPSRRAYSDFVHEQHMLRHFNRSEDIAKYYSNFDEFIHKNLKKIEKTAISNLIYRAGYATTIQKFFSNFYAQKNRQPLHVITSGLYFFHIKRWLLHFNASDLMVIDGERFLKDPGSIIEDIQDFLKLPKLILKEDFVKNLETGFFCFRKITEKQLDKTQAGKNISDPMECLDIAKGRTRGSSSKKPSVETMRRLKDFYKPFNEYFFKLTEKNFMWNLN